MSFQDSENLASRNGFSITNSIIPQSQEKSNGEIFPLDDDAVLGVLQITSNNSVTGEGSSIASSTATTLAEQEAAIAQGRGAFEPVGNALKKIRDQRLYQATHSSFNEYAKHQWGMTQRMADYLIQSADIMTSLQSKNFCSLPTCESQVRVLTRLPPELQTDVGCRVIEAAPDGRVTATLIHQIAQDFQLSEVEQRIALTKE